MNDLISIVVPIYNVAPYLKDCIESIMQQTYENIEIILVDDGSTDRSGEICDTYAKQDPRIKVIHQSNGGLTLTRRAGVVLSRGEYVGFVDGDDWIERNMYETLYKYAYSEKVDIVTSSGYREYSWGTGGSILGDTVPTGKYTVNSPDKYIINHIFASPFDGREHINGAVWNKLFKRDIIYKVLCGMDGRIHGGMDDNVCVVGSILGANNIYISHDCLYHHREREGSYEYSLDSNGMMQVNYAYLELKKILEDYGYKDELYEALCEHTSNNFVYVYNKFFESEKFKLPQYLFRCKEIPLNSKVVIYGAGKVGMAYEKQFISERKYEVVGFVDKDAEKIKRRSNVYKISDLPDLSFDFVIIAVAKRVIAEQIKNNLLLTGIRESQIICERPLSIFEYYR